MAQNSSRQAGRHFLHIPGPTPVPDRILRAMDTDGKVGLKTAPDELLDRARVYTRGYPRALVALGIIAALTLVRAGRRQALFYVGDEQLAKQTLASLLLRDEAATLELKLRYDPAWTGYFEYAGYLL